MALNLDFLTTICGSVAYGIRTKHLKRFVEYMETSILSLCKSCIIMDKYGWKLELPIDF
jgi:hypothetical protein